FPLLGGGQRGKSAHRQVRCVRESASLSATVLSVLLERGRNRDTSQRAGHLVHVLDGVCQRSTPLQVEATVCGCPGRARRGAPIDDEHRGVRTRRARGRNGGGGVVPAAH